MLSVSNMCKISLEDKLRIQTLQEQRRCPKAIVADYHNVMWGAYARSLPQAKEKTNNDCGTSNYIAEDLGRSLKRYWMCQMKCSKCSPALFTHACKRVLKFWTAFATGFWGSSSQIFLRNQWQRLFITLARVCSRRGSRKKYWGGGLAPLNFPSPPLFPTLFPSPPYPLNFPCHPFPPFPSLPFPLPPLSYFLIPSVPSLSPFLPLPPIPLEVGPLNPARGSGGAL